jgi:hypothetical protein
MAVECWANGHVLNILTPSLGCNREFLRCRRHRQRYLVKPWYLERFPRRKKGQGCSTNESTANESRPTVILHIPDSLIYY